MKLYKIAAFEVLAYFGFFPVDGNVTFFYRIFDLRTGKRFIRLRQKNIQTHARLFGIDCKG
jgi:hypothetical protein